MVIAYLNAKPAKLLKSLKENTKCVQRLDKCLKVLCFCFVSLLLQILKVLKNI